MDVPYRSSGASSRQHYALVHKIEGALALPEADRFILVEIETIRGQINAPGLSSKHCKELLILLLYCHNTITSPGHITLDFAIPHALNLAETGTSVQDKRLGYLFCTEIMPPDHELQLMLVNTLRKDLESPHVDRICLALDNIISSSTDDMIPAIQPRLHDLLGHNSDHVRRRALLAFRALSKHDAGIMQTLTHTLLMRLGDDDSNISAAALLAATVYGKSAGIAERVNDLFAASPHHRSRYWLLVVMRALQTLGLKDGHLDIVVNVIHVAASHQDYPILLEAFVLLSTMVLPASASHTIRGTVQDIRDLLSSNSPNDQHVFLSCISCVDPSYWAGSADGPALLEEREVGRFMRLLDSSDTSVRQKTIAILHRVDPNIVATYYSQSVGNIPQAMTWGNKTEYTCRLLEVLEIQHASDGESYARYVLDLFKKLEPPTLEGTRILEIAVEKVLTCIRDNAPMFQMAASTIFIGFLLEAPDIGTTVVVIGIALACEYCAQLSFPSIDILHGLSAKLLSLPPSVQDVALIAMLRVSLECERVDEDVKTVVSHLAGNASRYLRKRCEEFLKLSADNNRAALVEILGNAKSYSLPHVVEALMTAQTRNMGSPTARSPTSPTSSLAGSTSKLRYAAYDKPAPPAATSKPKRNPTGRRRPSETDSLDSPMSRTMTPGELALATKDLEAMSLSPEPHNKKLPQTSSPSSSQANNAKVDLIAFDTPFLSDPIFAPDSDNNDSKRFEIVWNDAGAEASSRGWFEGAFERFLERIKSVDADVNVISEEEEPFKSEVKVLLVRQAAALRVKMSGEGEEEGEGCLWRMRCDNATVRLRVKRALSDD